MDGCWWTAPCWTIQLDQLDVRDGGWRSPQLLDGDDGSTHCTRAGDEAGERDVADGDGCWSVEIMESMAGRVKVGTTLLNGGDGGALWMLLTVPICWMRKVGSTLLVPPTVGWMDDGAAADARLM